MLLEVFIFVISLFFIVYGSRLFVKSSSDIARKLGVSEFVIGLTLVALGTSLPELFSVVVASIRHHSEIAFGTIIGANIADLTLVVGVAAIVHELKLKKSDLKRGIWMLLFVAILFLIFLLDKTLSRIEGFVFLGLFVIYNIYLFHANKKIEEKINPKKKKNEIKKDIEKISFKDIALFVIGGALLYVGAEYLIKEAVFMASALRISVVIIGIIISIGTTMPEMLVGITSAKNRQGELAVGNSIGSVITNTLLVLGASAVILPISAASGTLNFMIPFLIGVSLLLGIFIHSGWKVSKKEGILLLLIYIVFWVMSIKIL